MRFFLVYALLVCVPVLALLGVLRQGERLTPPISVGGEWTVEALEGGDDAPTRLVIEQSGPVLEVHVDGGASGRGRLVGDGIACDGPGWKLAVVRLHDGRLQGTWTRGERTTRIRASRVSLPRGAGR